MTYDDWKAITSAMEDAIKAGDKYSVSVRTKSGHLYEGYTWSPLISNHVPLDVVVLSLNNNPSLYVHLVEVESVSMYGESL